MKKVTLLLAALCTFGFVHAQSNKEEVDLMQSAFGMEKKAMVAEFVKAEGAQKDAFWNIYDEYESKRKDLGKKRIDLLNQYAQNYSKLTTEFADSWGKQVLDLTKKTDALLVTYYNKVKKAAGPVTAIQFYQVESYILAGIRVNMLEQIPIPQLKK